MRAASRPSAASRSRSEERRVGKECRSWRDWSSDVCSSDLMSVPSAGNAANALAAYAAAAGIAAKVFMPRDVKVPFIRECELYGAEVTLVDGLITDAGRVAAERGKPLEIGRASCRERV